MASRELPQWVFVTEVGVFGIIVLVLVAHLVHLLVLWRVRLRFPLQEADARLSPVAEETAAERLLIAPSLRVTIESQDPSPHQAPARRPARTAPPPGTVRIPLGHAGRDGGARGAIKLNRSDADSY